MAVVEIDTGARHAWDSNRRERSLVRELTYTLHREWAAPLRLLIRVDVFEFGTEPFPVVPGRPRPRLTDLR